jgi:hypothetical protein
MGAASGAPHVVQKAVSPLEGAPHLVQKAAMVFSLSQVRV